MTAQPQGGHLWLYLDPSVYVSSHEDPWLEDSWVHYIAYVPNGVYTVDLVVTNRGTEDTNTYLLIAIPDTTTTDMFASIQISGGVGGSVTYVLAHFGTTEYNPYVHDSVLSITPIVYPYRQHETGSHGVYPPSGNAVWTTYHVGILNGRPAPGQGTSTTLSVTLTLGPVPDRSFKVHFDAYSLVQGATNELQYWTPPSRDATIASDSVASGIPADAVDVSGDNNYVAVGWGTKVSFFETYAPPAQRLKWTADEAFQVISVVLSEDGGYLAVTTNEVPQVGTTHAYLSLYRTADAQRVLYAQLDRNVLPATRPLDISRDGKYIAVGTAGWNVHKDTCQQEILPLPGGGTVYLFENPDLVPGATYYTYQRLVSGDPDCVNTVRLSGDGQHLAVGLEWYRGFDVVSVPNLALEATTPDLLNPVRSVAVSYDGGYVSAGQLDIHRVSFWRFTQAGLSLLWMTQDATTMGTHHQQVVSDDRANILTKQERQTLPGQEVSAFHLFDSTIPPDPSDKLPEWTLAGLHFYPSAVDMSVTNAKYGIGSEGRNVHLWVDRLGPAPDYTHTVSDATRDAAISYLGPIFAATDKAGFLYVFKADLQGNRLLWSWHP